jgi:hypothetical protein
MLLNIVILLYLKQAFFFSYLVLHGRIVAIYWQRFLAIKILEYLIQEQARLRKGYGTYFSLYA